MQVKGPRSSLSFSIAVPRGAQRFRELIVYISQKSEHDPNFGATKLNKIFYHVDFRAFEKFGVPLTGMSYFRLPKGPAPKPLCIFRRELENEGAIRVDIKNLGNGFEQHRTVALRDPVLSHFTADELELVDSVIDELWDQTATEVSDASHDIRWKVLTNQDSLPYEFAYLSDEGITESDIQRTKELSKEYGWMGD